MRFGQWMELSWMESSWIDVVFENYLLNHWECKFDQRRECDRVCVCVHRKKVGGRWRNVEIVDLFISWRNKQQHEKSETNSVRGVGSTTCEGIRPNPQRGESRSRIWSTHRRHKEPNLIHEEEKRGIGPEPRRRNTRSRTWSTKKRIWEAGLDLQRREHEEPDLIYKEENTRSQNLIHEEETTESSQDLSFKEYTNVGLMEKFPLPRLRFYDFPWKCKDCECVRLFGEPN